MVLLLLLLKGVAVHAAAVCAAAAGAGHGAGHIQVLLLSWYYAPLHAASASFGGCCYTT
jgi:hypothetical protein